jgi:hypothetical protein
MKRLLVIACLAAVLTAPSAALAAPDWDANLAAATRYANSRSGVESFAAIDGGGRIHARFPDRTNDCASTIKAMLLVAYLNQSSVRDRALTSSDRGLLEPMIRWSANDPATSIFNSLGPGPINDVARRAGMRHFTLSSSWGLSDITARDQARFFRHIDWLIPKRHRAYALQLLGSVISSQRWGIPRATPPTFHPYFKGGWLPRSDGWITNQIALLTKGGRRISLAILTRANPSFEYGQATVQGIAARLLRGVN